jgi:hypothetical protein
MLFGDAPADATTVVPALAPVAPPPPHIAQLMCMHRRLECLVERNRSLSFVGTVIAVGLAIWIFTPKTCVQR